MCGSLSKFTEDQLIEELAKRRASRERRNIVDYCDECIFFKSYSGKGEMPVNYNPCGNGHKMKFKNPEDHGDDWGFYIRVCADRRNVCT